MKREICQKCHAPTGWLIAEPGDYLTVVQRDGKVYNISDWPWVLESEKCKCSDLEFAKKHTSELDALRHSISQTLGREVSW